MVNWFKVHHLFIKFAKKKKKSVIVDQSHCISSPVHYILMSVIIYQTSACEKGLNVTWYSNILFGLCIFTLCLCLCLASCLFGWLVGRLVDRLLMNTKNNQFEQTHNFFMSFFITWFLWLNWHRRFVCEKYYNL